MSLIGPSHQLPLLLRVEVAEFTGSICIPPVDVPDEETRPKMAAPEEHWHRWRLRAEVESRQGDDGPRDALSAEVQGGSQDCVRCGRQWQLDIT